MQKVESAHRWDAINEETNDIQNAKVDKIKYVPQLLENVAIAKLALWFNKVADSGFKSFNTISATIYSHYDKILNFFNNRNTNASAESFNAKIKAFRATQRGVRDINFFIFRLCKIYA